jgi:glycosyltransferase involved in cell wall biosynthesis
LNNSVHALITNAEIMLSDGDIEGALRLVHNFVERIVTEPICAAQVFSSSDLDEVCLKIGRYNLTAMAKSKCDILPGKNDNPIIVYLVSRLQKSGGHSRLVQDFIREQPNKNHLILSTEIGGPSDKLYFSNSLLKSENIRIEYAPRDNFSARLSWLQSKLLEYSPQHVYLFNNHQDSVAVSAIIPELKIKGSFIHHGDHHLCLGVHFSHLNHIDLHPMGYHHCRTMLGIDNIYLPLTFEDKGHAYLKTKFDEGGKLITATAARSNKVEVPYFISYVDIIPKLLKVTGGHHLHIGKLTPWALCRIYSKMRKQGIPSERFIYLKWSPSVWRELQNYKVDLYIASFPYGAGLTLIEAMGAGVPVIMHEHLYSRVLSGLELAYPESFRWSDPDSLLLYLSKLTPQQLDQEKKLSRSQYEAFHRPQILNFFLSDSNNKVMLEAPQLDKNFKIREDEWAAWVESQLGFRKFLYGLIYRFYRKIRLIVGSVKI